MRRIFLLAFVAFGCQAELPLDGLPCPCVDGFECCATTNRCLHAGDRSCPPRPRESDCFDGADNNGDGLIDCADPTCNGIAVCTPRPPEGGTLGFLTADPCAGDEATEHLQRGLPDVQTCTGCDCNFTVDCSYSFAGDRTGAGCLDRSNTIATINATKTSMDSGATAQCVDLGSATEDYYSVLITTTYQQYHCTSSGGVPDPATFQVGKNFCTQLPGSAGGCAADQACLRVMPTSPCVRFAGENAACPSGLSGQNWYNDSTAGVLNISDGRRCQCGCSVTNPDCTTTVDTFRAINTLGSCTNRSGSEMTSYGDLPGSSGCNQHALGSGTLSVITAFSVENIGIAGGACVANGVVSGHVIPNAATAVTLCCP